MKKKILVLGSLVLLVALICLKAPRISGQKLEKKQVVTALITGILSKYHYTPLQLTDEFSRKAFSLHLKNLDSNKRIFLKKDMVQFQKYQNAIDDQLKSSSSDLFELIDRQNKKRLIEVKGYLEELGQKPIDFTRNEFLEIDPTKRDYCKDTKQLKNLWRLIIKYQTLQKYLELEEKNNTNVKKMTSTEMEKEARTNAIKTLVHGIERLLKEKEEDKFNRYLNAVVMSLDPHSEYMPPLEKQNFDINMTGTLEGIGVLLGEENDYIKVVEVVPGSAAWRQKGLQVEDLILKVAQGNAEPVDVVNMPLNDAIKMIRGKKGTEVRLTVKKPSGQTVVIPIIRDVVVLEETYAKSAVLTSTKTNQRFGYVYLPSFYHDLKEESTRNSAIDVKAELIKLNAEKVPGIILDLRNNGGGALDDAVAISGLFIKDGPVVQERDGLGRKVVLSDKDPQIVYDGLLVVLVNSLSASASEILAAALQDYGRAVIIGSESTYGKGTAQFFVDLDNLSSSFENMKPFGSLKLTSQKFYRVNGGSTQRKGVLSDIVLPDINLYDTLKFGEKYNDYPLNWDTVDSLRYQRWKDALNLSQLKAKSISRQKESFVFKSLNEYIKEVSKLRNDTKELLNLKKYKQEVKYLQEQAKKLENLQKSVGSVKVSSTNADQKNNDEIKQEKFKEWQKQIGKDLYINEAMSVLSDMQEAKK